MSKISSRLKQLRENLGMNKNQFANFLDISNAYITQYENNVSEPANKFYHRLKGKIPNLNLDWLITGGGEMYSVTEKKERRRTTRVPVLGYADCGKPASQWYKEEIGAMELEGLKQYNNVFAMKAQGDSMSPYINRGDTLVCADVPFYQIKDRSAVVVAFKSPAEMYEANAKLMLRDKDHLILYSVNTRHEPIRIPLSSVQKVYKLIRIIRDVN